MELTRRQQTGVLITAAGITVILALSAILYLNRPTPADHATPADAPASALTAASSPAPDPTPSGSPSPSASASPSRSRTPAAKPTTVKPKPKASLSPKPVTGPTPPSVPAGAPAGSPSPGKSCPSLTATPAPLAEVNSALLASAGKAYWDNGITLRPELMQAVGWEESGWQSTILACDGGIGTMQVMPATADWMNQQCDTAFNVRTLTGNVAIGAEYLEWLVRYFGDRYFSGNYSLKGDPDKLVLLDVVIAAYQQGFGTIDKALTTGADMPNWWYIGAVESLMTNKPWTAALTG
jgi:soluble lytic murein transglycosylase-like protein